MLTQSESEAAFTALGIAQASAASPADASANAGKLVTSLTKVVNGVTGTVNGVTAKLGLTHTTTTTAPTTTSSSSLQSLLGYLMGTGK